MKEKIKLALAQISSKREDKEANLKKIEKLTFKAKEQGADLAIFPEMSLTGYVVRDQIYELAETIPGPTVEKVEEFGKEDRDAYYFWHARIKRKNSSNNL